IRDSGTGIPEDDMHRLFDPFFTTKPNGTGLGLTTSLTIIRKHNGELRINSAPGEGTTAQILLPEGPWRC
ncbi:MAG: PAS domain-containing sensor histidine kinase, partial [Candidatus Omnitrophica bacterium]|nr:PAS domain-containing sensor histidine kinase [Candidatus Omnitrophota bacterium]